MVAMRPLKERLASKDIVFIYLTGPSSPMANWKQDLEKMNGVHYRLSEAQWKYLCQSYGITGIPAISLSVTTASFRDVMSLPRSGCT